ncbi:DNA-3-methyladenine glycosylase family protein [Paenibacillus sp. GCM10027628]|uniref:DNA-3-methyladenine glycosylase family protein n=1 Tax=Paenibacillus sp. GCM10027628 TaxID=3273413 RepID=UPI003640F967
MDIREPVETAFSPIHLNSRNPAIDFLSQADTKLASLIRLVGDLSIIPSSNPFESLVMSIISQQLSAKAAATIKSRVKLVLPSVTPDLVLAADEEAIRQCGVSYPKIRYIRDLSGKVLAGEVQLDELHKLEDDVLIKQLVSVKGIGTWTAEMFLIFALGRPDIMSLGDVGLQRAAKWLHCLEDRPDGNYLGLVAPAWAPYRSFASLYLWRSIDKGYVDSGLQVEACQPGQSYS